METPDLIVFGPQPSLPSQACIKRLKHDLLHEPYLAPLKTAISQLPKLWPLLIEVEPALSQTKGKDVSHQLSRWMDSDSTLDDHNSSLNVFATPFSVILQAVEYFSFLKDGLVPPPASKCGFEGMCTGFLTASAAALSENVEDFAHYASVSLRLALCIGAFVDLNGVYSHLSKEYKAIVVRWEPKMGDASLLRTLSRHPEV